MDKDLEKAIKGKDLGIPRGITSKTTYQGPHTFEPIPIGEKPPPRVKPFQPCVEDLISRLNPSDQSLVRQRNFVLSGERFPKSPEGLADRLEGLAKGIRESVEDPAVKKEDNRTELLELFAIFSSHYIHYI